MKKVFIFLFLMLFCQTGYAVQIKAVVGDEIITDADIAERKAVISALLKTPVSTREVLEKLVEEKIKWQTAQKEKISITDQDTANGLRYIENQNKMPEGQLKAFLRQQGLSVQSLEDKIKAEVAWLKYVGQRSQGAPEVSKEEIDKRRQEIKSQMMQGAYLLAEIYIPFGKSEKKAKEQAEEIFNKIVSEEASFTELAKKYSKGKTADRMGDLGWVKADEMEKAVKEVVSVMASGQLSRPIKGKKGFYIVLVRDIQPPLTEDNQVILQVAQFVIRKDRFAFFEADLEKASTSCMLFAPFASAYGEEGSGSGMLPEMLESRLPAELADLLKDKKMNTLIGPVEQEDYLVYLMKCGKREESVLPNQEVIKQQIVVEKMEQISLNMFENARDKMVVEIK